MNRIMTHYVPSPPCPPLLSRVGFSVGTRFCASAGRPDAGNVPTDRQKPVPTDGVTMRSGYGYRRGAAPPRFYCCRFVLAAKPPKQTDNNFFARASGPIRITCRAVALKTHVVVRDVASFAGNISHDNDILWGPEAPKPPPGGVT